MFWMDPAMFPVCGIDQFPVRGMDAHISEDSPKDPHWTEWREEPVLCLLTSFPIPSLLTPFPGRWLITSPLLNWFWRPRYANFHFSDVLERSHVTYIISSCSGWVEIRSWQMQLPFHCTHFVSSTGRPCFVAFCRYCIFLQVEGLLWQPCIKPLCQPHFPPSICSLHASVSHFANSRDTSNHLPRKGWWITEDSDDG